MGLRTNIQPARRIDFDVSNVHPLESLQAPGLPGIRAFPQPSSGAAGEQFPLRRARKNKPCAPVLLIAKEWNIKNFFPSNPTVCAYENSAITSPLVTNADDNAVGIDRIDRQSAHAQVSFADWKPPMHHLPSFT